MLTWIVYLEIIKNKNDNNPKTKAKQIRLSDIQTLTSIEYQHYLDTYMEFCISLFKNQLRIFYLDFLLLDHREASFQKSLNMIILL